MMSPMAHPTLLASLGSGYWQQQQQQDRKAPTRRNQRPFMSGAAMPAPPPGLSLPPPPGLSLPSIPDSPALWDLAGDCGDGSDCSTTDLEPMIRKASTESEVSTAGSSSAFVAPAGLLSADTYVPGRLLSLGAQARPQMPLPEQEQEPPAPELRLSGMLEEPALGTLGTPSLGSAGHYLGMCRPCDFVCRGGACRAGVDCRFCHLCGPSENRRRKRENIRMKREFAKGQQAKACI
eukprot:TRINITY_DN48665_c0_g1_i1.p2 TRINITY_DN48665_c0_g1~~TRINITY_DN48665_c0_g1_i1.p2  ORF type:complete len:257 (+),score=42.11 TRINITY_DN48665_c0_g1_i1:68-772(+)